MVQQINTQYSSVQVYTIKDQTTINVLRWLEDLGHPISKDFEIYAMVMVERVANEEEFNGMFLGAYKGGDQDSVIHVSFKPTMPGSLTIDQNTWAV